MSSITEKPLSFTGASTTLEVLSSPLSLACIEAVMLAMLQDFSKLNLLCEADHLRDIETLKRRLKHEGLSFVTKTLPELFNGILCSLEGRDVLYPSFKTIERNGLRVPVFLRGLARKTLNNNHPQQKGAFDALYQICVAFKKLRGPYKREDLLGQFVDFVKVDKSLSKIDLSTNYSKKILGTARGLITRLFKDFDLEKYMRPRPGPGSTCTPVPKSLRFSAKCFFPSVDAVLPYQEWFYPNPWYACLETREFLELIRVPKIPCARLGYVPKTFGKARGICMEENEIQFMQQGVRRAIEDYLAERHPDVWMMINTHDQKRNQLLALYASINGANATIDESEASDRIWRELVRALFANTGLLVDAMMALSTQFVLPPKDIGRGVLRTHKFAPMGSGLCFPVMTLVHWCLIRSIIMHSGIRDSFMLSHEVSVYGDDIIIPSTHFTEVTTKLPLFGMKINVSKSYVRSGFRESCGLHAFKGATVTPVYLKYIPKETTLQGRMSLNANIRDLRKKGFLCTANSLQELMLRTPFSVRKGSGIFGVEVELDSISTLSQYRSRWNSDYQCFVYRIPRLVKAGDAVSITGRDGYLRWLLTQAKESDVVDYHDDYKLSWSWVPAHIVLNDPDVRYRLPAGGEVLNQDTWPNFPETEVGKVCR